MLRLGTILLLLCMVPAIAGAEDQLPALEEVRANVERLRDTTSTVFVLLGLSLGVYAYMNWDDSKDIDGAPQGRHLLMMAGGLVSFATGLKMYSPPDH